ncbi:unnamed protein product [Cladocopium goreaui]|uniref:Pentatricopeptide repeat-containing protein MRL1, chloroplastic n=1 Tax=Cladocopium goreaui TaxID=2562237 RepID=A0A9P1C4J9_9DINO|nr:unnamed protein product [Cladocopium goreaui]
MRETCSSTTLQGRAQARQQLPGKTREDIRQCTSSISEHSRQSRWRDAISLWCELPDLGLEPNTFTFNAAMAAYSQGSLWQRSLDLFEEACLRGVKIDTISLNTCLSARKGTRLNTSWKSALSFLMPCQRATLQLDVFTCTAFFSLCKGRWWLARTFLEAQRQEAIPIAGNLQLRNAYMSAALKDDWDLALWLLQEPNMPQDAVTLKAVSGPFSRSTAWEPCMALMQNLKLQGQRSAPPTFLLSSLARAQLWQRAMTAMAMASRGPQRFQGSAAITAAVSACERANQWQVALVIPMNLMLNQGLQVDLILYNTLLSACRCSGFWDLTLSRLQALHGVGKGMSWGSLRPDVVTFSVALEGLGLENQWMQACEIARDVISSQKVDGTCYSSILSSFRTRSAPWSLALLRLQGLRLDLGNAALLVDAIQGKPQGAWIEGCHQLNQLEDEGMKLWSTSAGSLFGAMLRKLQAAQQWLKAMELFEMLGPECRIQTSFAGNVLACLRGAGLREEALHLCQELSKNQLQLDQQLLGVVLSLCDRADLWQTALSIFTSPWPCSAHLSTDGLVAQGATIASCASAGQWRWCIRLLPTSGRRMVPGPMGNALMNAMAKARAWKASVSWLRMGSSPLGLSAMNAFTSAMLAAPEWARVMDFLSWIRGQRLPADTVTAVELMEILEAQAAAPAIRFLDEAMAQLSEGQIQPEGRQVSALELLLRHDRLHHTQRQRCARTLRPLLRRMGSGQLDLEVFSLGDFTWEALQELHLHPSNLRWLEDFRWEVRRNTRASSEQAALTGSRSARKMGSCEAHRLVTVRDSSHCHMLANKHPDVRLSASMEGAGEDPAYSFQVAYGEQVPFAGRGPPPGHVPRLRLTVQHAADAAQQATVMVDLHRSGAHRVPLWSGGPGVGTSHASSKRKSTLRVSAAVSVVLRNRVAVVTVAPVLKAARAASQPVQRQDEAGGDDGENEDAANLRTFNGELRIDQLFVGLVIEGSSRSLATSSVWGTAAELASTEPRQRREAFTIALAQVVMNVAQTPNRCRDVQFQIWDIQVDMQSPKRDVILKSTSQPALRTHTKRDDVRMLDVHLREVQLELGHLEVSVTGALMDQARLLRRNLTVGMGGLTFEQVLARAKGGIHLSNPQPPSASSKLVVNKLVVGDAKVDVWCQLHIPDAHYLPKSLRDTIQVFSLGATRLDIKGAQVRLSHQALFKSRPAEGNTSIVFSKVWDHYLPLVKNCWRSLLQHSNIFLGGFLSRHTWNPRQRRDWPNADPLCQIGSHGELQLRTPE